MSTRRVIHCVALATLALTAAEAEAVPVLHDGRYYEIVIANKISWEAARAAAGQRTFQGIQGHLATIGTPQEDAFVHQLRQQRLNLPHPPLTGTELWVGGQQLPCATTTPEPACGWMWINGEAISPVNTASPYTNWLGGEPNNLRRTPDANTRATEDHLAIGLGGAFGWNDEGSHSNVWGYVVEYGDKIPATSCTASGGGCNPTGAQLLTLPATAKVADDATLSIRTTLVHDTSGRCGKQSLSLFGGAVIVPPYLCGHPDFLVIESHTSGVEVPAGAIEVENLTEEALPGNLYDCVASVGDLDPSHRDVVAWQSADRRNMLENALGTGRYFGSVTEVTYACGSSRGRVVSGSYHFVGLRIHPGFDNEFATDPAGNHQSFVELIRYKLEVLAASVEGAKPTLPGSSFVALRSHVKNAIQYHDRGQYGSALHSIRKFLKEVAASKYRPVAGENPSGDHLMRGSNLEFMYTEKLLPFAQ